MGNESLLRDTPVWTAIRRLVIRWPTFLLLSFQRLYVRTPAGEYK